MVEFENYLKSSLDKPWNSAPIIVFRNNLRNAINTKAVIRKSIEENTPLIVCVANDIFPKSSFRTKEIIRYSLNLDDNKTDNLPGYLPLVSGLKILIIILNHSN